ncbi:hypothetical protein H1R20_g14468, partial [Candolleomyces eurysporus]
MQASLPTTSQSGRATTGFPTNAAGVDMTDVEPSDNWKNDLLKRIQGELAFVVKDAKNQLQENIRRNPETRDILLADHRSIMDNLHRLAVEEFWEELELEREERSWAMGISSRINCMDPLLREEQELIYHQIMQSEGEPVPDWALDAAYRGPQEQAAESRLLQQTVPEPTAVQTGAVPFLPRYEIPPLPPNMPPPPPRPSASASSQRVPTTPIRGHSYYRRDYNNENGPLDRKDREWGAATSKTPRVALGGMDSSVTMGSGRPLAAQPTLHADESRNPYRHSAQFGQMRRPVEDQSFSRASEIEEKRKSGETERQRAEKERERDMEHRKGVKEEEIRLGRIKREQESRRPDEERERRRLRKVHQAAPLCAASVDITNLESNNANGAREEWSVRLRKERKEQEEARRLNEESKHKQMQKEAPQGLDCKRPAVMRPQLGEAANEFDNSRKISALSYYSSRMPVMSTRPAPSTLLSSRSINRPSTVEQHNTAYSPPTGSVKGKVASPPPPKILDPRELHRLKGESEQKKPRVAQEGERDKQPERELEREQGPGQGREPERRETEREQEIEPPREKEKEQLEAQVPGEQERENRETEKSLQPLTGAGEKVEDAPKLALQAESKQLTEAQPESSKLDHQTEEADKLESELPAEHCEVEGQHKQPSEPQPAQRKEEQNEEMPAATVQLERGEQNGVNVPVLELTNQWKATLKSRIDEEIGVLIQRNTQWFKENVSKAKEGERRHLQTELENIRCSLNVLRSLTLEMLNGDVAEMVILVERESKGEGEAITVDIAKEAGGEYKEEGAVMCVQAPGPKKEPPAIDPGRTEEDSTSPGIEPGTDAEAPARNDERLEKDVEGPAKDIKEPTEDAEEPTKNTDEPTKNTEEPAMEDTGNGEVMPLDPSKNAFASKPRGGGQRVSPLANAHHFVIHHATFINSETANISTPIHGM